MINSSSTRTAQYSPVKPVLIGAGIALALTCVFLAGVKNPDPTWGKFWMIRPLIVVAFAGGAGGVFYNMMRPLRLKGGGTQVFAVILSIIVYVIGLWLGSVIGFNGTLWN